MARKAGLKGDLSSIAALKAKLRKLPLSIAIDIARRASPVLTGETRGAFASGRSVYGDPRPLSQTDGKRLTLERTGAVKNALRFVNTGTIIRCVLGPKYSKYLIGKFGILPNGPLPAGWSAKLAQITRETKVTLK